MNEWNWIKSGIALAVVIVAAVVRGLPGSAVAVGIAVMLLAALLLLPRSAAR